MRNLFPVLTRAALPCLGGMIIMSGAVAAQADETPAAQSPAVSTPAAQADALSYTTLAKRTEARLDGAFPPVSLQIAQIPQSVLQGAAVTAPRGGQLDPVSVASKVVPIAIRLGALVSPRTKFVGGADFSFPNAKFGGFYPRIDAEAIISANFGAVSTLVPITFNAVYSKTLPAGTHLYGGAGIGPYFGEVTRFGGKLFVGGDFNRSLGVEADLQFAGQGDALVTIAARIGL